ncbi:hypothetical protein QP920_03480, partial [Corynebacterium marquesiae]|uniref:hypothetical protein n=1 Tax=Corynebacterium marquesiae TaxID=2913503 RepID=UPI00254AE0AD
SLTSFGVQRVTTTSRSKWRIHPLTARPILTWQKYDVAYIYRVGLSRDTFLAIDPEQGDCHA